MGYTITPSADGKYIVLKVTGDMTRRLTMDQNLESHAMGKRLGINRYLVDVTESRNVESVIDNYRFAYEDMRQAADIDKSARVAVLVSPDDHSHDFVETAARNAGLNVTLFTDRELAVRHLLEH